MFSVLPYELFHVPVFGEPQFEFQVLEDFHVYLLAPFPVQRFPTTEIIENVRKTLSCNMSIDETRLWNPQWTPNYLFNISGDAQWDLLILDFHLGASFPVCSPKLNISSFKSCIFHADTKLFKVFESSYFDLVKLLCATRLTFMETNYISFSC